MNIHRSSDKKSTPGWICDSRPGDDGKVARFFFQDWVYGGKDESLKAAEEFRKMYHEEHPEDNRPWKWIERVGPRNRSGHVGVSVHASITNSGVVVTFVATIPKGPGDKPFSKRWSSVKFGMKEAKERAVMFRRMWEHYYLAGKADEFWQTFYDGEGGYDVMPVVENEKSQQYYFPELSNEVLSAISKMESAE